MHHLFNNLLKPLGVFAVALVLAHCHVACAKPPQVPQELLYSGEVADCVNQAKNLTDSHVCRAKVNWRYGLCPNADPSFFCNLAAP